MLVLSRKVGEKFYIGDAEVMIVDVDVHSRRVRLGITAPSDITITRAENRKGADDAKPVDIQQPAR